MKKFLFTCCLLFSMVFAAQAQCPNITNLKLLKLASSNFTFTFTPAAKPVGISYLVEYKKDTATSWINVPIADTSETFGSLTTNQMYYLRVRSYCGVGDSGTWSDTLRIRTECLELLGAQLPIVEGFNGGANVFPDCWRTNTTHASSTIKVATTQKNSSPTSVTLTPASGITAADYTIIRSTPIHPGSIAPTGLRTRFYARPGNLGKITIAVGILPNPVLPESFVPVDTIEFTKANTWEPFTVSLAGFSGTLTSPYAVAYRAIATETSQSIYLDDVVIEKLPTCPDLQSFKLISTEATSVKLSVAPSFTTSNLQYQFAYRKSDEATWQYTVVNNATDSIGALTANQDYLISARAYCNSGADTGLWAMDTLRAKTECPAIEGNGNKIIFYEKFNGVSVTTTETYDVLPACWRTYLKPQSGQARFLSFVSVNRDNGNAPSDSNALRIGTSTNTADYRSQVLAILPPFKKDADIANLRISLSARSNNVNDSNSIIVGFMTSPYDTLSFTAIDTFFIKGTTATAYKYYETFTNKYAGTASLPSKYYIALKHGNSMPSKGTAINIDNVKVDIAPACPEVRVITKGMVNPTSVGINFESQSDSFQVAYRVKGTTAWTNAQGTVDTNYSLVTGLTPSTTYEMVVKPYCDGGKEGVFTIEPFAVTTRCAAKTIADLPLLENFDAITNCWNLVKSGGSTASIASGVLGLNSGNVVGTVKTSVAAIILPPFNATEDFGNMTAMFSVKNSGTTVPAARLKVQIGITTDPDSLKDFVLIKQKGVTNNNLWYKDTISFFGFKLDSNVIKKSPEVLYLVIKNSNDTTSLNLSLDSLEIRKTPTCAEPINLTLDSNTFTEVSFSWAKGTGEAEVLNYSFSYMPADSSNAGVNQFVTDTVLTITGLTPKMVYNVSVRANCLLSSSLNVETTVRTITCDTVQALMASDIANDSATISWTIPTGSMQDKWLVRYATSVDFASAITTDTVVEGTPEMVLKNLAHGIEYTFVVYTVCAVGDTSDASSQCTFATTICKPITAPVVSNTTRTSTTINWVNTEAQGIAWQVSYSKATDTTTLVDATDTIVELSGLDPRTTYTYSIRSICGVNDSSEWISFQNFTTAACGETAGLTASNVTATSVDVSWTKEAVQYEIRYGAKGTVPSAMTGRVFVAKDAPNTKTIESLLATTEYDVAIRSICAAGDTGTWSAPVSFTTTQCQAVSNLRLVGVKQPNNQVEIAWNVLPGQTHWHVNLVKQGEMPKEAGNIRIVDTNWFLFAKYVTTTNTDYTAYVRTSCGTNAYSGWSTITVAKTSLDAATAAANDASVIITPNPAKDFAKISINGTIGLVEMSMLNAKGEVVMTEKFYCEKDFVKDIDLHNLAKGTYFINLIHADWTKTQKLIVR